MRRELEGFAPRSGMLLAQRGGNHIVQDIGGGNCALCAHLRTGSITVESGDQLDSPLPPRPHWSLFSSRQAGRHRFNPGFTGSYQHDVIPLRLDVMNSRPRYCQSACCTRRFR